MVTKTVYKYDMEGNYLNSYKAATDIKGFAVKNISQVCNGEKKSHLNYRFSFKKVDKLPALKRKKKTQPYKKIVKYSINGIKLKEYKGVKFIDDMIIDSGYLSKACNFNTLAYGYKWRYKE
jgi:hypothetical protein